MITPEAEHKKYQRMWTEVAGYRSNSPGEGLVKKFLAVADWEDGDSLVDLGCGPGRASLLLQDNGLRVTMLDIAGEALDKSVKVRAGILGMVFIEQNLWDVYLSIHGRFDWLYCCDVLEHIPTEHVDATLNNMRAMTGKGAFLQIALWDDSFGNKIGETLHLTVKPIPWWREKIESRWNIKLCELSDDHRLIVLTGSPK
jgi:SAM-dependent methyltransferase